MKISKRAIFVIITLMIFLTVAGLAAASVITTGSVKDAEDIVAGGAVFFIFFALFGGYMLLDIEV